MKSIKHILAAILTLALLLTFAVPAGRAAEIDENGSAGYVLKLKEGAVLQFSLFGADDASPERIAYTDDMLVADTLAEALPLIRAGLVEYCVENVTVTLFDDELTALAKLPQWYQNAAGIDALRGSEYTGAGVKVGVVDSGILKTHEDLNPGKISGKNFAGAPAGNDAITDTTGHGTFVSGIIAAQRNTVGVDGIADGAELIVGRAFEGSSASLSDIISALGYAVGQNADVINMSFGGENAGLRTALQTQINTALGKGIILVAAAGNSGAEGSPIMYPAAFDGVIGVGAIDSAGVVAPYSTKNTTVDVTAPGSALQGLWYSGNSAYATGSGTSFAAPVVAAMAALVREANPKIDSYAFLELLKESADDKGASGYDVSYGHGAVNGAKLRAALEKDRAISYALNGGVIGEDYITTYKISDLTNRALPTTVTRGGYTFAGWYGNELLTGGAVTAVPDNAIGGVTYYAKWEENTAVPVIAGITVRGIPAEKNTSAEYTATLPAGTDRSTLNGGEIVITPVAGTTISVPPATVNGGETWTFTAMNGTAEVYTLNVALGAARPSAGSAASGAASPAPLDGGPPDAV
ncbi:MAG: S8 family serine peptidase [Oscillospiraceae bacterium]|jgi:uncharacterized repeat protein (TIGR02543 family)|nr:S8 family serine peptidase [Oscillospiraceae bacterium]